MKNVLVVDQLKDWDLNVPGISVISSTQYLTDPEYQTESNLKVFNLCRSYAYQTSGYYVSLLASARSHKAIPSIETILDMKSQSLLKIRSQEFDQLMQKSLKDVRSGEFMLSIYFGKNLAKKYDRLASELHQLFHAPLLRAKFIHKDKWRISQITPIALKDVPKSHFPELESFAAEYFDKRVRSHAKAPARFSLAILVNEEEQLPPSNPLAIQKFIKAAQKLQIDTELINRTDYSRLAEFDGLFIRETTAVNHHTYRFAQRAQALGLVVIDDPVSIMKCTNKVYLAELFKRYRLPAPKTILVHKDNLQQLLQQIPLPAVLKQPDSAFSHGVIKVSDREELRTKLGSMLQSSDLVVVQEYLTTEFDWRVTLINGKPLFGCRYYMARNHWQIYKHKNDGSLDYGKSDTLHIYEMPQSLVKIATKAASHIGNGLYGLDIKEKDGQYYIIEINDNPSIDAGTEDKCLKDVLYEEIMHVFLDRMEHRAKGKKP